MTIHDMVGDGLKTSKSTSRDNERAESTQWNGDTVSVDSSFE